jgi:hypothetical protein
MHGQQWQQIPLKKRKKKEPPKDLSRLQKLRRVKDTYKRFLRGQKAQLAPGDSIEQVHKVELQEGMRNESCKDY